MNADVKKYNLFFFLVFIFSCTFGQNPIAESEAEDGILVGVTVQTTYPGFSGTGYVGNFSGDNDQLIMSCSLQDSGRYKLVIWYGGFSGTKTQEVLINGKSVSSVVFPASTVFTSIEAGTYLFKQGENTVTIKKSWGYMTVDKIQLFPPDDQFFQIDKNLVDIKADENTWEMYEFLKVHFGERIISGQTSSYFNELKNLAGSTPMLQAGDLSSYTEGYPYLWKNGGHTFGAVDDGTVEHLINWHNSTNGKGIVSLQWHWHSPAGAVPGQNNFYTENTDFDVRKAVTPGTDEYNLVIRDIDAIAVQLKRFENAEVPVLWRPLHEAGGGWFWWGAHGSEACLKLYDIIYQRLMIYQNIHNLIWVWSTPEEDWYPGNEKVDIVGYDSYPGTYNYGAQNFWFDKLYKLTGGKKLIAMSENGPIPDVDECFEMKAPWLYFMSWSNLVNEQNEISHIQSVFNHQRVVTLESENTFWRSSLYPDTWYPGFKDSEGRFLHDFSYAGYHLGEDSIPFITNNVVDITQPPYNADNTGTEDVTTIIQTALDEVGIAGGGVVYLPTGTYRIREQSSTAGADAALHMKYDSVVLRGDGPDETYIFHDQTSLRQKDIVHIRKAWSNWADRIGTETKIRTDIIDPTKEIPVESVNGFSVGDLIIVRNDFTTAFVTEHLMEGIWDNTWLDGVMFIRRIDSIDEDNNLLFIDIPTRYYLKTRDNARVYHAGPHIRECGIENLSFGNRFNTKTGWDEEDYSTSGTGAYDVHASHVMQFKYAENCWVRNVSTFKPDVNTEDFHVLSNCLLLNMCRNITVDSCDFQKSQYEGGGGNGYMFTLSGNDCLIKNCRANDSRHNYDFKLPYSNGNVILNCRGENSKYSSDFHMYLSMANLIDGFIVNGDYLECAFRPYGGEVIHGYPSTQSVFYNTYGESYHVNKNYIIDSRQFDKGYVIGTSGPADQVKTTPVAGTMGNYEFNTAPEDFVEGVGKGRLLRPASLYYDQFQRRMQGYKPPERFFFVNVEVKDDVTGEAIPGARVILNDTLKITDSNGMVSYSSIPEYIILSASMDNYYSFGESTKFIDKDTTIRIRLAPFKYDVTFLLLDSRTEEPFWGVNVYLNEMKETSDSYGMVYFSVPENTYDYLIDKLSYQNEEGSLYIISDTTLIFHLTRSEAYMKFRLMEGVKPVNKAYVIIDSDSIESNNLGIALFSEMPVNKEYNYIVKREAYSNISGNLTLITDTTINIAMVSDTSGTNIIHQEELLTAIWPNPSSDELSIRLNNNYEILYARVLDIRGRLREEIKPERFLFTIKVQQYPEGIYFLQLVSDKSTERHMFIKY